MFITKTHLPRRTFLRGVGVTLALPLLDAMLPAQTLLKKTAAAGITAHGLRLCSARRDHGPMDADDGRRRLRVLAGSEAAGTVSEQHQHRQRTGQPRRGHHRGSLPKPHHLAERRTSQAHAGRGCLCWRHRGPDCGAAHRAGHAAAVHRAGHRRSFGAARRLRSRLRLHLHEHAVVAHPHHADADGDQSAQSLRAHVRTRRIGG